MTQKKTIPWGGLVAVLFFMDVMAYYVSGLYLFSDVTINNYSEKLTYILLHFYNFLTYYRNYLVKQGLILDRFLFLCCQHEKK